MSLRSAPRVALTAFATFLALPLVLSTSRCGNQTLEQAGSPCFLASDCAAGLVCIPSSRNGSSRICSSNTTSIETEIDSGVDAASAPDGTIAVPEASPTTGDSGTLDTGAPEVGTSPPPLQDAGHDAGHDAGSLPPGDAGHDAGEPSDTGSGDAKKD